MPCQEGEMTEQEDGVEKQTQIDDMGGRFDYQKGEKKK